jgi:hypothetical protein
MGILLLMVSAIFITSCNKINAEDNDEELIVSYELDPELEARINAEHLEQCGWKLINKNTTIFYGLYNGAAVFFLPGDADWIETHTISCVEFKYRNSWMMKVYKDGVFYDMVKDIDAIFKNKVLNQRHIELIGEKHRSTHGITD